MPEADVYLGLRQRTLDRFADLIANIHKNAKYILADFPNNNMREKVKREKKRETRSKLQTNRSLRKSEAKNNRGEIKITFNVRKITEDEMTDEMKNAWNSVVRFLRDEL